MIRLNHRRVLTALLERAGVPAPLHGDALVALDKLDKIGADGVTKEFAARGIPADAGAKALSFFVGATRDGTGWRRSRAFVSGDARASTSAGQPDGDRRRSRRRRRRAGRIRVDPSLARGLSYYTGAIMEIAVEGIGSLGGGGRYDNLVGMFLGRDVPACGFSLGLERIIVVMTEREMFPASVVKSAVDIVVTFLDDPSRAEALTAGRRTARGDACASTCSPRRVASSTSR